MDEHDFLTVAERWILGSLEAEWRSAVSRAYYAAFHLGRRLLRQCGFAVPHADQAHAYLARRLANAGHPDVCTAGARLNSLRGDRNRADYDLHLPMSQAHATAQVQVAKEIIRYLDAATREPIKTQITDAMKIYERDVLKQVTWHP